jgi:hypothetical protein
MPRENFYMEEERLRSRVVVLKEMVAEQTLHDKPCKLLASQLNELEVLCGRLLTDTRKLSEAVAVAIKAP